jgi:hypothetical protein
MNERIQLLAEQAGDYVNEVYTPPVRSKTPGKIWEDGHIGWNEQFQAKFAELIVRECYEHCKGQILDKEVADTNELTYNDAVSDCANGLLQHFGVEE